MWNALSDECKISTQLLRDRTARFPHAAQVQFWRVLEEVSGDKNIGLHLANVVPVYRGQVLEYLFLSSPNFGDGLRGRRITSGWSPTPCNSSYMFDGDEARVVLNFCGDGEPELRHRDECFVRFLQRYFDAVTDGAFEAREINLSHEPQGDIDEYQRHFNCPVHFAAEEQSLVFDSHILSTPSSHAEPDLLKLHEKVASKQLERLSRQDVVGEVKQVIAEVLSWGSPVWKLLPSA